MAPNCLRLHILSGRSSTCWTATFTRSSHTTSSVGRWRNWGRELNAERRPGFLAPGPGLLVWVRASQTGEESVFSLPTCLRPRTFVSYNRLTVNCHGSSGCRNSMPRIGWLTQWRYLFLTVLEARKAKVKVPGDWASGEKAPFLAYRQPPPAVSSRGGEWALVSFSSCEGTDLITAASPSWPHLNSVLCQRSHIQLPQHGIRTSTYGFWGDIDVQCT